MPIIIIFIIIIIIIRCWYNMPNSGKGSKWNQSDPTPQNSHVLFEALKHVLAMSNV
jgi:hypothetical protein